MVLITGGVYQGKASFAKQRFGISAGIAEGKDADWETLRQASMILHFHDWIAAQLKTGADPMLLAGELVDANPDVILSVTELGCGIVPMDAFDREWREVTGRVCCMLAARANAVYRVTCGIGTQIK